ncbi:hypothetical protein [Fastidiosibacter lacustris]|uniref:hypothetical protein n=1 Tax=Fastidiosibacter lacustris TaxID=2056695 RepID=UPI000E34B6D4|nr:hypothetical protein [Fastidiosibacter lacustris]
MDYLYECLEGNKPVYGSIYYYAYRRLDNEKIEVLYALDQLKHQWIKASEFYQEPYPALKKLQWWQTELEKLKTGKMLNHPLLNFVVKYFRAEDLVLWLNHDLNYALQTIAKGRQQQLENDLSDSFLGVASLKAKLLGCIDRQKVSTLNASDQLIRHLLLIGKHYSRNISLDARLTPQVDQGVFREIAHNVLTKAKLLRQQLKPFDKSLMPFITLNKLQLVSAQKFIKKVDNPFRQSIVISPLLLLFTASFASKL